MAVVVLGVLFFGIGTQAAALLKSDRIDPQNSAQGTGNVESSGAESSKLEESSSPVPEETTPVPEETTEDVLASHQYSQESTTDEGARDETLATKTPAKRPAGPSKKRPSSSSTKRPTSPSMCSFWV